MNDFISATVVQSTPIVLAALAAMFTQRGNILNVGVEGMMLTASFTAIAVGMRTGSASVAVLGALLSALLIAALMGVITFRLGANPFVAGLGVNLLASGGTVFLLEKAYESPGGLRPDTFPDLWKVDLGPLAEVPLLGPMLQGQTVLVLLTIALVPWSAWLLYRTRYGFALRAVGEDESAAKAAGISIWRTRFISIVLSGLLGGLAGAQLSMASLQLFLPDMTSGRGFLGLAAMLFGGGTPLGSTAAAVFFGAAGAAGDRLQALQLPPQLVLALPYLAAVVALSVSQIVVRRRRSVSSKGLPA